MNKKKLKLIGIESLNIGKLVKIPKNTILESKKTLSNFYDNYKKIKEKEKIKREKQKKLDEKREIEREKQKIKKERTAK